MANQQTDKKIPTKKAARRSYFIVAQEVFYQLFITGLAVLTVVQVEPGTEQVAGVARESISTWNFLALFLAMTFFVLFVVKSVHGTKLIGAIFALAIIFGVASLANTHLGPGAGLFAFAASTVIYYLNPTVLAFNLILSLGLAGVAASVGFGFHPMALLVVMAILAIYDVIAVYFTKHMVRMAKQMLRRKVFFAMILPEVPTGMLTKIDKVSSRSDFAFLGTGDLVLPALFAVSVASVQGIATAIPVVIGAILGLLLTNALFLWQPQRKPMPALPPIVIGAIAGYAITFLYI